MNKYLLFLIVFLNLTSDLFSQNYVTCQKINEVTKLIGIDLFETYFECDGVKCNGQKVNYLKNGEVQIKGEFINGRPIDTLYEFDGEKVTLRYVDTLKKVEWFLNSDGSIKYSTSGFDKTYYDNNKKKVKSIFESKLPASYRKWIVEYDENENPKIEYSEDLVSHYLNQKSISKHIYNLDSTKNEIYSLTFCKQNKTYFLVRKYYSECPKLESEINSSSIIAIFKKEGESNYIYDLKKKKYYKTN